MKLIHQILFLCASQLEEAFGQYTYKEETVKLFAEPCFNESAYEGHIIGEGSPYSDRENGYSKVWEITVEPSFLCWFIAYNSFVITPDDEEGESGREADAL